MSAATTPAGEIDFFACQPSGRNPVYVQVALTALDEATLRSELSSFTGTEPGARCVLLTVDRVPLSTGHVLHVNAADFLAGANI